MNKESRFHLVGLNDHPDGDAYLAEHHEIITPTPIRTIDFGSLLETALKMLNNCDHVCIVSDEDYEELDHTLLSLAPYCVHITKGCKA